MVDALVIVSCSLGFAYYLAKYVLKMSPPDEATESEPTMLLPGKWKALHEGNVYFWLYKESKKLIPSSLEVSVDCFDTGCFQVNKETWLDRFCKKTGLAREMAVNDETFDNTFFISTNSVKFTKAILDKLQNRKTVNRLFEKNIKRLELNSGKLKAVYRNVDTDFDPKIIPEVAALLLQLTNSINSAPSPTASEIGKWKRKKIVFLAIPLTLLLLGISGFISSKYKVLGDGNLFVISLIGSIPLWIIFYLAAIRQFKGQSSSHYDLVPILLISIPAFLMAGLGGTRAINFLLDDSQPVAHQTLIVSKEFTFGKSKTRYYIKMKSWRHQGREEMQIPSEVYDRIKPHKTKITMTTKAGKLGCEWFVKYKVHFNQRE